MKIAYAIRSLEDSGVTVYVLDLAAQMRRRGHEVFIVGDGGVYEDELERRGLGRIALPLCSGGRIASYRAARRLTDVVRRKRPDLVHANWRRAQLAAHIAWKRTGVPFVSTLHTVGIRTTRLQRWLTHWGHRVIAPCTEAVAYLRDEWGVAEGRIRRVFHGVDPEVWPVQDEAAREAARRDLGLSPDAAVIVAVGRLEWTKAVDVLIRALSRAAGAQPSLELLLIGSGHLEAHLRGLAAELGVADRVRFLGFCDPRPALAACDALALASWKESFGLAPVEAMASGRAVIRTDSQGAADQIVPGQTGVIVPRGDVGALAEALEDVARRRDAWRAMGPTARQRVVENFTLERMAERTEAVYDEVLGEKG